MPDTRTPEWVLIRQQERAARPRQPPPERAWPPSAFHDPTNRALRVRVPPRPGAGDGQALFRKPPQQPSRPTPGALTPGRTKISTTLDASALLDVPVPDGKPRVVLAIQGPDRIITASVSAKSMRRVQKAIRDAGADNVTLVLQGHLAANDAIAEAGLSVQPRAAKPPSNPG